jgi:NADPH:quinone reductase-like Zn-dependent oxidoreductase
MEPQTIQFSIAKNVKKGVVHVATYAVSLGTAWLAAKGFTLTPEQQNVLVLGLTGAIGTGLTMLRNWVKVKWPQNFGWL